MDVKDSYLHGTVGVVKSINVAADKLIYNLADVNNTSREVPLPLATTATNGLLSSSDYKKLRSTTLAGYGITDAFTWKRVISSTTTDDTALWGEIGLQTYGGVLPDGLTGQYSYGVLASFNNNKDGGPQFQLYASDYRGDNTTSRRHIAWRTGFGANKGSWQRLANIDTGNIFTESQTFQKQIKSTIATGTAPFSVASTTLVTNLNADMVDGYNGSVLFTCETGNGIDVNAPHPNKESGTLLYKINSNCANIPPSCTNGVLVHFNHPKTDTAFQIASNYYNTGLYYRSGNFSESSQNYLYNRTWKQLAFTDSDITGNAATATKLLTARKIWGQNFDGTGNVSGGMTGVTLIQNTSGLSILSNGLGFAPENAGDLKGALTIGGSVHYGLAIWSDESGKSYLQSGRTDGTNKAYNLIIQHLGGNIGIGTTSPTEKLQVDGNVKATSFIGNLDWSYITSKPDSFTPADHDHSRLKGWSDTRGQTNVPNDYNRTFIVRGIKTAGTELGLTTTLTGGYATIIGWRGWSDSSGGYAWEIASTDKNRLYVRSGSKTTWNNGWSALAYTTDNFPTSLIDKLTGYTKATTISAIATTDTLNTALSKLEAKADQGVLAYNWYQSVTLEDTDDVINKWGEVVDFVNHMSNDLTDEFVTRKTELTIIGAKTFSGTTATILTVDRDADKPTYIAFKNKGTLKGYLGIDSSEKPVYTNSSANISYILHSGNYTNYKHSYTNLTGSTTTANQAIVSNGTKDGWKLLTLGPGAFLDDYPMLNLGTLSDYVEYVLLLHPINGSTDWKLYYSYGTIYTHRSNGLSPCSSIIYNSIPKYNSTDVYVSMVLQGRKYAQWCTCTYNRLKYCGLKLYTLANHSSDLTIKGRWNSDPVLVKYKTNQKTDSNGNITSKEIIHNEEIANSIVVEGDDIIIKSTHGKFNGTFEGNITGGTVGSVLYQSTADITSFLNPPSTESILTSKGGVPYWTSLVSVRGYIGTTAVQSSSKAQSLTGITSLNMSDNINILSGNSDKYITFGYSNNAFTSADAYSWRLGYIGSGENNSNYFKIQSSHGNTWTDVLKLGLLTYEATFSGNVIASGNVTASKFITSGGTASQFVKGDGSLDSTSYISTTTLENYVTKTEFPNLSSKGLYKILTSSSSNNINKWKKFARINLSSDKVYTQCGGYMFIYDHEGHLVKGILDFHVRTIPDKSINNSNINLQSPYLTWHILDNSNYASNIKMVKVENGIFDLYITTSQTYITFVILVFTPRSDKITLFDETWIDTLPENVICTSSYTITVPNATTATKLANTLTFSAGAFVTKTYNGSSATTINIPTHTSHLTNNSFAVHNDAVKNVISLTRSTLGYACNSGANADTFWHASGPVAIFGVTNHKLALQSVVDSDVLKFRRITAGSYENTKWRTLIHDGNFSDYFSNKSWNKVRPYIYDETNGTRWYCYKIAQLDINSTSSAIAVIELRGIGDANYAHMTSAKLKISQYRAAIADTIVRRYNVALLSDPHYGCYFIAYIDNTGGVWVKCHNCTWASSLQWRIDTNGHYDNTCLVKNIYTATTAIRKETTPDNIVVTIYPNQTAHWESEPSNTCTKEGFNTSFGSNLTTWYNDTVYDILRNNDNSNVVLNSCGGGLYIGYENTSSIFLEKPTYAKQNITAAGFVKSGSSDLYVLLGGGGHKAIGSSDGSISLNRISSSSFKAEEGWYRIAHITNSTGTNKNNIIVSLQRSYNSPQNEHYIFAISVGWDGQININQLSGCIGGHIITKIRAILDDSKNCYLDCYIKKCDHSNGYRVQILAGDCVSYQYPLLITDATSVNSVEVETVNGISSNYGFTGNLVGSASKLTSNTIVDNSKAFGLSSAEWVDTGYTFTNLATGTYAVQVTSETNLVASGIMSIYLNLEDTKGDEIPLHVYGTANWRPYLRTHENKLLISSSDTSSTSRTVTIKIALIL